MPRQKKPTPWVWIIVGGVVLCCVLPIGVIGGLGFWGFNQVKGFAGCMYNFKDAQKAVLKYANEHGGKLPNAATWQDDVREDYRQSMTPKLKGSQFQEMSPDGDWGCKDSTGIMTGMAFNKVLSGKKLSDIGDQVSTAMLFETEHPAKNLTEEYKPRPFSTSPKMFGGIRRGWIETPVSGTSVMTDQTGRRVPLNTPEGGSGVSVNTN